MTNRFEYAAEREADRATAHESFAVNLHEVRRAVTEILSHFGRNKIFHEYTTHDISHIDKMLLDLDWLIPQPTWATLSPAEWLMIVLSIYFHDLGLIVTEDEFAKRSESGFDEYCEKHFFSGPDGADYKAKLQALPSDDRERQLYQEYVRANHHRRINAWILGRDDRDLGSNKEPMATVSKLLAGLDTTFRRDLAMVCESHNLDDIDNQHKYKISYPYGDGPEAAVNLQYCAIILRTVDLIQIRRGRAPSISHRLINPKDPISQVEWAKQNAVRTIRPKPAVDDDGNESPARISDTIEIFAKFSNANGFFGLTSYLRYANEQLSKSHAIARKLGPHSQNKYLFPWRHIDDSNVEADGFIRHPFEFVIDQEKVLNLLTGHTLYNDTAVVVRELTQNAIDAVRLQAATEGRASGDQDRVTITWDSKLRELKIADNGTGMSQEIIENHFLKVGSSLYQDGKFREKHPNFSSISRFGIGVLTAFMVADNVEIVTVSQEEHEARQVTLRSVHGKYLIRLLNKKIDKRAAEIGPHGTAIVLTFRASATAIDISEALARWIVVPRCCVELFIDDDSPVRIGYKTPKEAVEAQIRDRIDPGTLAGSRYQVVEHLIDGVTIAFALGYNSHFRDWNFIPAEQSQSRADTDRRRFVPATCIEGIAVTFDTPGLYGGPIFAIADAIGKQAPRTNVARSALEITSEYEAFLQKVYRAYFLQVSNEISRLTKSENYSLTWAVEQATYLMAPALGRGGRVDSRKAHTAELADVPIFLVEAEHQRRSMSLRELHRLDYFWTVESQLMRSVETFIREANVDVTARSVLSVHTGIAATIPSEHVLANYHTETIRTMVQADFEVTGIYCNRAERRLQLRWTLGNDFWRSPPNIRRGLRRRSRVFSNFVESYTNSRRSRNVTVKTPVRPISVSGLDDYFAVLSGRTIYLLSGNPVVELLTALVAPEPQIEDDILSLYFIFEAVSSLMDRQWLTEETVDWVARNFEGSGVTLDHSVKADLRAAIAKSERPLRLYNPYAWPMREIPT